MDISKLDVILVIFQIVALLIAAIGHEIMHGLVALKYGDNTARREGRLSINPRSHIDLFGSIIIPLTLIVMGSPIMFGYAKPVPVDIDTVRDNGGYKACMLVALAGVFYNFFMAFCCVVILKLGLSFHLLDTQSLSLQFFFILLYVNIVLGVFNLLPIPPLDGSKALAYLGLMFNSSVFASLYNKFENYGMIILILLLLFPLTREAIFNVIRITVMMFLTI
ncbi:site-2 protease family protein [Helicobacter aurati]|uniref:Site-2 protease family protein n=1 Tax=Helicobacter aurati TaxID=137778 RepID=A0A3D8J1J7_9HELI|nr:site-2 protease family protein [Helicobacter aurati]RDU71243.1 site-2 protease family protein [Helicobacter aurati]